MRFQTDKGSIVVSPSKCGGYLWLAIDTQGNHYLGTIPPSGCGEPGDMNYARVNASIALARASNPLPALFPWEGTGS